MTLKITSYSTHATVLRDLNEANKKSTKALEQLSSGERLVDSADDVAGKAIVTRLKAQVRSLRQADRNAQDGVSMIQVAEGGLSEITNSLARLRELSVQSSSDTLGTNERELLHREYQELVKGIDQITDSTRINYIQHGRDNDLGVLTFQVGSFAAKDNTISFDFETINTKSSELGIESSGVKSREDARDSIGKIDKAIEKISAIRADVGAIQSRLQSASNNIENHIVSHERTRSVIEDADVAKVASELVTTSVRQQSAVAVLAQTADMPRTLTKLIS